MSNRCSDAKSQTNDYSWYSRDTALSQGAANLMWTYPTGRPYKTDTYGSHLDPVIMSYYLVPTIGFGKVSSDPINVAAQQFYSDVRHKQTGSKNYDPADLMIYCVAMANVYSYINFMQRIYQTSLLYSQENAAFPNMLLESMGAKPSDVKLHQADLRYGINSLIRKAAATSVPATMDYFKRVAFLYTSVYTEGSSIKDQLYLFNPSGFLKYTLDANSKGMLQYVEFINLSVYPSNLKTVDQLISFGEDLLANIFSSEDAGTMSGDILNAYGESNLIKLQTLPEESPLPIGFDINVLEQMKNANVFSSRNYSIVTNTLNVTQNSDNYSAVLQCAPVVRLNELGDDERVASQVVNHVLTQPELVVTTTNNPGPEITMENTRLKCAKFKNDATSITLHPMTEIVRDIKLYPEGLVMTSLPSIMAGDTSNANSGFKYTDVEALIDMSRFQFSPFIDMIGFESAGGNIEMCNKLGDVDNFTIASQQDLDRLNEAALLNLFHVNSIGRV